MPIPFHSFPAPPPPPNLTNTSTGPSMRMWIGICVAGYGLCRSRFHSTRRKFRRHV